MCVCVHVRVRVCICVYVCVRVCIHTKHVTDQCYFTIKQSQDSITEGLHRIKIILQNSKQLFGAVNHDNRRTLPLSFDGKRFLLQEQPEVCSANTMATSHTDKNNAAKTSGVSIV